MAGQRPQLGSVNLLERIRVAAPLCAAFLHVGPFPMDIECAAALAAVLQNWFRECVDRFDLKPAMWLQGPALHSSEAVNLLVDHAREWMPDLGLGIRPGEEPPRMINAGDLSKLRWDQTPQPKHETAFHLMNGVRAADSALPLFCGTGVVLYCLLEASAEVYLREQRELWVPTIQDPAFRAHSFYIPFFGRRVLAEHTAPHLLEWMGRAIVYLRESIEDNGILVLSSRPEAIERLDLKLQAMSSKSGEMFRGAQSDWQR